jgi:molybdopterin-guanine dinucleotide biosynthesis protein A
VKARARHARRRRATPVGVVLAGGEGRRIGGAKALVELGGRPLICYPLEAVRRALGDVAVVAKLGTELPELPGLTVWIEPDTPRHPLVGIVHALGLAGGRPVLVCAADLPFVTPALVGALAWADAGGSPAVVASSEGRIQPLLGCYQPCACGLLAPWLAGAAGEVRLGELVARLGPRTVEAPQQALFNVNTPDDLLVAAAMLDRRGTLPTGAPTRT